MLFYDSVACFTIFSKSLASIFSNFELDSRSCTYDLTPEEQAVLAAEYYSGDLPFGVTKKFLAFYPIGLMEGLFVGFATSSMRKDGQIAKHR